MFGRIRKTDIASFIFLFFISIVFLYKQIFLGFIPTPQDSGQGDITHYAYPILDFYSNYLHQGVFPLWLDTIANGHPIVSEGQIGPFFPPNLLLYSLLETPVAFNLSYLFTFLVASFGMYFYARFLKLGTLPSLLSSVVYSYSFVFITHMLTINVLQSIAFFPFIILFSERLFSSKKRLDFVLLSLFTALQFLAGFPQTTFYSMVGVLLILTIKNWRKSNLISGLGFVVFSFLMGILLSGVQLFPMIELYLNSTRGFSSQGFSNPFTVLDLAYILNPFAWGDPSLASYTRNDGFFWENNFYFGLIPLGLVCLGLLNAKTQKIVAPYVFSATFWLLFSLGLLFFISLLPPFSFFRLPQRSLFLVVFSLAISSGFVFQFFKKRINLLIGIGIVIASFLNLFLLGKNYNGGLSKEKFLQIPITVDFVKTERRDAKVFSLGNAFDWNRIYKNEAKGWQSDRAEKLLQNRSLLHPNSNVLYGVSSFYGYNVFRLKNANDLNAVTFSGSNLDTAPFYLSTSSAKLLGAFGVSHILAPGEINSDIKLDLPQKFFIDRSKSTYFVYSNPYFVPQVRSAKKLITFPTIQQQAKYLLSSEFDPVLEATAVGFPGVYEYESDISLKSDKKSNGILKIKTNSPSPSFIVVSQSYYPGWKLTVDGVETNTTKVNLNAIGFSLPPGKHEVHLIYDPLSFKTGVFVSLLTLASLVALIIYPKIKKVVH